MYINLRNNQKPMTNGFMAYGYYHEPHFYQLCLPGWCFQQIYMWLVKSCSELVKQILINAVKVDVSGYEDTLNYAFFNKQILFAFLTQFGACTVGKFFFQYPADLVNYLLKESFAENFIFCQCLHGLQPPIYLLKEHHRS